MWSSLVTVVFLASVVPNHFAKKAAEAEDLLPVRLLLVVLSALGVAILVLRVFEFGALNVAWDQNVYGSLLWVLLGLHTAHLLTDVIDTVVLTILMFTRHGHGKRFADVADNAFYWDFVVLTWLPIWALVYWAPRL